MTVRAYVPATLALLAGWWADREVPPGRSAHAVTDRLRSEAPDLGEEDGEYVALTAAAQDAVALMSGGDAPRRVVLAVDVPAVVVVDGPDPTGVRVPGPVCFRDVAAIHVDSADAAGAVAAARASETEKREAALERCLDHELGWFATQEIEEVLGLGTAGEV